MTGIAHGRRKAESVQDMHNRSHKNGHGGNNTQDSGGRVNPGSSFGLKQQDATPQVGERRVPAPRWCPPSLSKTQQQRLQKLRQVELAEKHAEEECDQWFNWACPIMQTMKTWKEKRLAREEESSYGEDSQGTHEEGGRRGIMHDD
jgi:hypothetical protein